MRNFFVRAIDPPRLRVRITSAGAEAAKVFRWCIPALVIAIGIRALILAHMPAAFLHNDTASIVETADTLIHRAALEIEGKKTFLTPLVYSAPALVGIPILPFVAFIQHLLGVIAILVAGVIVRLWFRCWRMLIIPVTVLIAIQPVMLWYEHAALAECWAIFGILLVTCGASLFWKTPDRYSLAILFACLLFMAGARPEGRLFSLFALVLVARAFWGNWPPFRIAVPCTAAWTVFLFLITKTGQGGLLLFTSVLHLTPEHLVFSPGLAEATRELAEQARADWAKPDEAPRLVRVRKALQDEIVAMQMAEGIEEDQAKDRTNKIAALAGMETSARSPFALPGLAVQKFVIAHREYPALAFNDYSMAGQLESLYEDDHELKALRYAGLLWGRSPANRADAGAFLREFYQPVPGDFPWKAQVAWMKASLLPILPIELPGSRVEAVPIHGVPWLYFCALLGMIALALRDRVPLNFHQLFGLFLIALFVLIMVTANIRARFRVMFEPMWILYAFALLDTLLIAATSVVHKRRAA